MRISTRTRYAARALAELAKVEPPRTASLQDLARLQEISPKYVEGIFTPCAPAACPGPRAASTAATHWSRPPETTTLREVCELLDGSVAPVDCVDCPESCSRKNICTTRDTWGEVKQAVAGVLERTTLRDLAERRNDRTGPSPPMYPI